jgi:hypothetical protein
MEFHLIELARAVLGLTLGGAIGVGFGFIQQAALRRYEKRQAAGTLDSSWAVIPGSMSRVALLLIALVLVQLVSPMLFADGIQWLVSVGLVAGYGALLLREFFRRRALYALSPARGK